MTKLDDIAQYAKDAAREAMEEARRLQEELGVPENERCKLPPSFNRYRSTKRFDELTTEFDKISDECRDKIAAKKTLEAGKPVNRMLTDLENTCALDDARKRCQKALAHAQKLQRNAGLTVTPPRSLKKLSFDELNAFEAELVEIVRALSAQAKAEREAREAKIAAEAEMARLAKADAEAKAQAEKTREDELRLKRRVAQLGVARQRYNELKRLGRARQPFEKWAAAQGYAIAG